MAKITLPTITSGFQSASQLSTGFDAIESELQNKVLYRDNPTGEPNQMENDLDMNSNGLLNVSSITVNGVDYLANMQNVYNDYNALVNRVTISTESPSGGSDGDIWFKVSA